jgi:addiction module RelB/DinJ family antitoxin
MKTVIQTRIDLKVRQEAESVLNAMGLSISDGIRMFLQQVVNERALPFQPRIGDKTNTDLKTLSARIEEGKNIAISHKPIFV